MDYLLPGYSRNPCVVRCVDWGPVADFSISRIRHLKVCISLAAIGSGNRSTPDADLETAPHLMQTLTPLHSQCRPGNRPTPDADLETTLPLMQKLTVVVLKEKLRARNLTVFLSSSLLLSNLELSDTKVYEP